MSKSKSKPIEKRSFWEVIGLIGKVLGSIVSLGISLLILLFIFNSLRSMPSYQLGNGNVAIVPLTGVITIGSSSSVFEASVVDSTKFSKLLKDISEENSIKAVVLEINSPGGSPVASDEIGEAVKKLRLNKTVVSVIREVGASGAYWIASGTEKIFANRMAITGSIGVIGSHLEFAGLLKDYNVTYRRLVSGKYKDLGTPYKEMSLEEQEIYQKVLDGIHTEFIDEVSRNRNLSEEKVRSLATGMFYLGSEAKELGLVDEIGNKEDAIKYIEAKLNITAESTEVKMKRGFFESFADSLSAPSFNVGRGIGSSIVESGQGKVMQVWT